MSNRPSPQIFVSYSHHDAGWRQQLFADDVPTTLGLAQVWTDTRIRAGDAWQSEIDQRLQSSAVAVLLVSKNFLASKFINDREYPQILKRAATGRLRVVWIPVGISLEALQTQRADLVALQCATGLGGMLPDTPQGCPAATLQALSRQVHDELRLALDHHGADLARLVEGRYEVQHRIGEGNLASVYQARDPVLNRLVAIKVLKDPAQRLPFMNDVTDAVRASEEPNFINIYDAAREQSTAYCVMQLVRGRSLQAVLQELRGLRSAGERGSAMSVQTLRQVFVRLVAAMARAHAKGIVYGNLKPSNIMLDEDNEPFILPIGRRRDRLREFKSVQALVGRLASARKQGRAPAEADQEDLAYLVPDQFSEQFEAVNPRLTDQYMLGLLAYEMATGERPLRVADPAALLTLGRAAFAELPSIALVRPLCPERIVKLVARMAAIDAGQRHARLDDVLAEADLHDDLGLVIARDSYRRCAQNPAFDSAFFKHFYADFLARCPDAAPAFQRFGGVDWQRQHSMLKQAVLLLFAFAKQQDANVEPNLLSRIAATHAAIPPRFYAPFLESLVVTVCGNPDGGLAPFDDECRQPEQRQQLAVYWRQALAPGVRYLRDRAELARDAADAVAAADAAGAAGAALAGSLAATAPSPPISLRPSARAAR